MFIQSKQRFLDSILLLTGLFFLHVSPDSLEAVCLLPAVRGLPQVVGAPRLRAKRRPRRHHQIHQGMGVLRHVWIGCPRYEDNRVSVLLRRPQGTNINSQQENSRNLQIDVWIQNLFSTDEEIINHDWDWFWFIRIFFGNMKPSFLGRTGGLLRRRSALPLAVGGCAAGGLRTARTAPQSLAAVLLRQSPASSRGHLGARILPLLSGTHQTFCSDLKLSGHQR